MIRWITAVSRGFAPMLLAAGLAAGDAAPVWGAGPGADPPCWKRPGPETLEEILHLSGNDGRRSQRELEHRAPSRNVLLLSDGYMDLAYGAGLIVGWGETGRRPRFAVVTAAGAGALIALFAFLGLNGDPMIGEIFNCPSEDLEALAARAASLVDTKLLAEIAREHNAGRRLLIALQRSPARPAAVWDIGLLAAKGNAEAVTIIRAILRASIGPYPAADTQSVLEEAKTLLPVHPAPREMKSGREFLLPAPLTPVADATTRYYFIHNDPFALSRNAINAASRKQARENGHQAPALLSGDEAVSQVVVTGRRFGFAAPDSRGLMGLFSQAAFDHAYLSATFRRAFRNGRMGKEWTAGSIGERQN
jgi:hypothetical protein